MRSQLRLTALCIVGALAAGCSGSNTPTSTNAPGNNRSAAQCTNTIGNRVWFDTNCNGIQDSVETAGPEGVVVTLRNCDTQEERTTTTDANGNYGFTDVANGSYVLCVDIPAGYKASLEDRGIDDNVDSDINTEGCTGCRIYSCEADDVSRDAGLCVDETGGECDNTVGSRVWFDTNCNGVQDPDETTGPEGVKVTLTDCTTQVERTTNTDSSGNYHFSNVATGDYRICIDIPAGYKATLEDEGADDNTDSDINAEGCTGCRTYTCDTDDLSRDAGLCVDETGGECSNTVGNRVWYDTNCNGIQDKDETGGPEGIKVVLRNCATQEARATATDANGFYQFTNVPTGDYEICIEIPGGFAATLENQGGNDGVDSDIDSDGCTGCHHIECGSDDLSRDAGLCEKKTPPDEETQSCSPGFWRNHLTHWAATPYSPSDKVNATFGCHLVGSDNVTLAQAIDAPQTYGTLVFHAIAALLNASHPDIHFGLSVDEVLDAACAHDKATLAEENEVEDCPLSGGNTTGGGGKKK